MKDLHDAVRSARRWIFDIMGTGLSSEPPKDLNQIRKVGREPSHLGVNLTGDGQGFKNKGDDKQ
jgi:hypothetical protein